MPKEKKTRGEDLVNLVDDWIKLDNPSSIRKSVREWTKNSSKEKSVTILI